MSLNPVEIRRKALRAMYAFKLRSYMVGERMRRQSSKQTLSEFASGGKQCFCVGTGPSLDCVDLDQVRDSTVLLLNGAFRRIGDFQGRNNRIFWFAQDVKVLDDLISSVPDGLPKIFTVNKFSSLESIRRHFRPGRDVFLQPRPTLRDPAVADPDRASHFSIWPGLFTDLDPDSYDWDLGRRFHVALRSVAFSATFFALHFSFEKIIGLGMDLPSIKIVHPHADSCGQSLQGKGFGVSARDRALKQLVTMAEVRKIGLLNASPLAETDIIPRRKTIESALG